jgi:hypothetical protein
VLTRSSLVRFLRVPSAGGALGVRLSGSQKIDPSVLEKI